MEDTPRFTQGELQEFANALARLEARFGVRLRADNIRVATAPGSYGGRTVTQDIDGELTLGEYAADGAVNNATTISSRPLTANERGEMAWAIRRRVGIAEGEIVLDEALRAAEAAKDRLLASIRDDD